VTKSFRTGRLERELQMVQLSATRCSSIAIIWVSLVSFAAITLCVASQRVFNFGYTLVQSPFSDIFDVLASKFITQICTVFNLYTGCVKSTEKRCSCTKMQWNEKKTTMGFIRFNFQVYALTALHMFNEVTRQIQAQSGFYYENRS
jgi:hypothetical protein